MAADRTAPRRNRSQLSALARAARPHTAKHPRSSSDACSQQSCPAVQRFRTEQQAFSPRELFHQCDCVSLLSGTAGCCVGVPSRSLLSAVGRRRHCAAAEGRVTPGALPWARAASSHAAAPRHCALIAQASAEQSHRSDGAALAARRRRCPSPPTARHTSQCCPLPPLHRTSRARSTMAAFHAQRDATPSQSSSTAAAAIHSLSSHGRVAPHRKTSKR